MCSSDLHGLTTPAARRGSAGPSAMPGKIPGRRPSKSHGRCKPDPPCARRPRRTAGPLAVTAGLPAFAGRCWVGCGRRRDSLMVRFGHRCRRTGLPQAWGVPRMRDESRRRGPAHSHVTFHLEVCSLNSNRQSSPPIAGHGTGGPKPRQTGRLKPCSRHDSFS